MKETKTTYAYLIEHMKEPTFEKVRNIACDFVQKLPSELIDELHDMLNRGVDILDSEPLMQMYFYSYGSMHSEKLTYAFQNLNRYITATSVVDLIDYGCGQGLATMCYHDFILNNNPKQQVRSITLIEPSEVALARAELLCSCFFPNAVITSINKPFDELIVSDINIKGDIPTLHLFSNILDIDTYSVKELSDIIKASYKGDNEFVIVSPMQNAKRLARLKDFVDKLGVNCYFEKYLEKQQLREDKDWTCSAILCSTIDEKYAELYLEDVQTNVDELVDNAYSEKINNDLFRKIRIFSVNGITYYINRDRLSVTLTYGGSEDIDSLTIPETVSYESQTFSVTSIGDSAFKGCSGLASITIPKSVTTIKARAFQDCIGLKSIKIPNSVTSIWYCAFRGCTGLTGSLTIPNSVTSISKNAFDFCSGLTSLIIGNSLTEIEMGVFWNCSGLTSVYIPNSVTSIGNSAFAGCSKLASVTIPDSVSSIGSGAFDRCSGLTSIKVEVGNKFYDSRDNCNAIIETLSKKLILGCKNTVIPNSVTSIGEYAFDGCNELTSITIPNSVNLIDNSAFYGCRGLTSITIPISVTSIGTQAFACCNSLKEVYVKWDNPPIAEFSSGAYRNAILFVPKEKVEIYSCSDGWRNFSKIIEEGGPEAVKWYRKAAEQGNARAQFILGYCYAKGNGVIQSYNEAAKWFRKAAEQGNVRAQFNLGNCYAKGNGVEQDYNEAAKWFRKAAEQGNVRAQFNLGVCYKKKGVAQSYTQAIKWYRKAAEQDHTQAQISLGICYAEGNGVEQDYNEAAKWFRKAAEQGNARAQFILGYCYAKGNGVIQSYNEAAKWFRKAAEQGNVRAQFNLGNCYAKGNGVEQDYNEAAKWFRKAAEQGDARAQNKLGVLYFKEAIKLLKKAASQGNEKAKEYLGKLGVEDL